MLLHQVLWSIPRSKFVSVTWYQHHFLQQSHIQAPSSDYLDSLYRPGHHTPNNLNISVDIGKASSKTVAHIQNMFFILSQLDSAWFISDKILAHSSSPLTFFVVEPWRLRRSFFYITLHRSAIAPHISTSAPLYSISTCSAQISLKSCSSIYSTLYVCLRLHLRFARPPKTLQSHCLVCELEILESAIWSSHYDFACVCVCIWLQPRSLACWRSPWAKMNELRLMMIMWSRRSLWG